MSFDLLLEEADKWHKDAWNMIQQRSDMKLFLLTKHPERIERCLPAYRHSAYENVMLNVL